MPVVRILAIAALLCADVTQAIAGRQAPALHVTATVVQNCTISSTDIAFGAYTPAAGTPRTATGAITALCTKGDVVSVALNQGLHPAATSTRAIPARQMVSGAVTLRYHISFAGANEWGTGAPGTQQPPAQTSAGAKTPMTFMAYGEITPGQDVPAGIYADTVTATITY